jgi:hypothetical protein
VVKARSTGEKGNAADPTKARQAAAIRGNRRNAPQ